MKSEKTDEEKELIRLKEKLKDFSISEEERMETLLELLFSEEDRKIYRERYYACSELLEKIPDSNNPFLKMKFGRVDFKKHDMSEFDDIAQLERSGNIRAVMNETIYGSEEEIYRWEEYDDWD